MREDTLILIKPDGVARGLIGPILQRFERAELQIAQMRLVESNPTLVRDHYPAAREWMASVGTKTLRDYEERNLDPRDHFGAATAIEIGRVVHSWLQDYLNEGPIVAAIIRGSDAIRIVRKMVGATLPINAAPGTIRGDYSADSAAVAAIEGRAVRNLIHASGSSEEALRECELWFGVKELRP